jgi:hypothetical protein
LDNTKLIEAKVAHGASCGADVERIAGTYQDNTKATALALGQHNQFFKRGGKPGDEKRGNLLPPDRM